MCELLSNRKRKKWVWMYTEMMEAALKLMLVRQKNCEELAGISQACAIRSSECVTPTTALLTKTLLRITRRSRVTMSVSSPTWQSDWTPCLKATAPCWIIPVSSGSQTCGPVVNTIPPKSPAYRRRTRRHPGNGPHPRLRQQGR